MASPESDLSRQWKAGHELSFAWRIVPDPDLQAQYRSSREHPRRLEFAISLMKAELRDRLGSGALRAIGVQIAPAPNGEIRQIPTHFFADPDHVDWDHSRVVGFGCAFEHVRVLGLSASVIRGEYRPAETLPADISELTQPQRRRGRPRVIDLVLEAYDLLVSEGALAGCPEKERTARIRDKARALYPERFLRPTQPGRSTIMEALALARERNRPESQRSP